MAHKNLDPLLLPHNQIGDIEESENYILSSAPQKMPVLPVRDIVVFNYMILPLFVGRKDSIAAVEDALTKKRHIFVVAQKSAEKDGPAAKDLYRTGTICVVMRVLKMPDERLKILVQGVARAKVLKFKKEKHFRSAEVQALPDESVSEKHAEEEALMRAAKEQSEQIITMRGLSSPDILAVLASVDSPGKLADLVASNLRMQVADAQKILACTDPVARLRLANIQLAKELNLLTMQARIQAEAKEGMEKAQKEYFLREQLKAIRHELGEGQEAEEEINIIHKALEKANPPEEVRKEAEKQLKRLQSMHKDSSEATVIRTYLDWIAEVPWNIKTKDRLDISRAEAILNKDHYGLSQVKERILEYLSVRKLNPALKGTILCFAGPPGVGKTSLGRSIANALGRKFQRISLGGMRDEAEIRGHRRTYIGSMPGRIIQGIKQAGHKNPVFILDEVDKLGSDFRGDPSSALLEVLDPEQNFSFTDHYLNVPFDLSEVMFICTANTLDTIPSALRDRMEIVNIHGYTKYEKLKIARNYLLPRQRQENGLKKNDILLSDNALNSLITGYTREAGLRSLEREIGSVCRKLARRKAKGEKGPFRVTPQTIEKYLGPPRFTGEEIQDMPAGVAIGLAWTPYGGEILHIEASTMPGKGKLLLTGQLGDVMKESAHAALSYAKAHARELNLQPDFATNKDIHIHIPAGATPKDGPSAGVTLITALVSAFTGRPVKNTVCMTGEVTLRGRVLPVGGIKEKILAAVAHNMEEVLIPRQNKRNLVDVPRELLRTIKVHLIEDISEVWALVKK